MAIQIDPSKCTGCYYCVISCPTDAISLEIQETTQPIINEELCTLCGDCLYFCPNNVFSEPELERPPKKLESHYDAILIGAGIGGLMTAAGLAKAGKNVLVLEKLSFIGGKYTHLNYQGYAITTAAWTCPGPNSRIGKLTKKLGADINWITIHEIKSTGEHWILTKDGHRYSSPDEAQEAIVGGKKGMGNVYRWIADMYDPNVTYPDDMTACEYIRKFVPDNETYEKYVEMLITYCFASQTVDTFSAMETKRAIVDAIEQMKDWGTAIGGTSAIVSGVEKVILDYGGTIVTETQVDQILLENNKAIGVKLHDGRTITADVVIHNGGIRQLIRLVGEDNLPEDYAKQLHDAIPATVAALILGSKEPLLGEDHSLLHTMGWDRTINSYAPTFFDPDLAPEGRHILDVFWVLEPPYNIHHEMDIVLKQLHEVFPNFDETVELIVPMFFRGGWTAEMAHRLGQSGDERLNPHTPVEDLYLVGYDCIGYGIAGDIIPHSVEYVLHHLLNDPTYAPEDEKSSVRFNKLVKSKIFKLLAWYTDLTS